MFAVGRKFASDVVCEPRGDIQSVMEQFRGPVWPPVCANAPLAVLVSGGLDSAILVGEAIGAYPWVQPIYIRTGSAWERIERTCLERFLAALKCSRLRPLLILDQPTNDIYGDHWSVTGANVPARDSADDAVFLPGRNVLLLTKAMLWCHLNGVPSIAMAPLSTNPFPDATVQFFEDFEDVMNRAIGGRISILRPYAVILKGDVMRRGRKMPLEHTFSCIAPIDNLHCGRCNKCAERIAAFAHADIPDPTVYALE